MYKPASIESLIRASLGAGARSIPDNELDAYLAHLIAREDAAKKLNKPTVDYSGFTYVEPKKPAPTRCKPDVRFLQNLIRHTEPSITPSASSSTRGSEGLQSKTLPPDSVFISKENHPSSSSTASPSSTNLVRKGRHFLTSQHSGIKGPTMLTTVFNDTPAGKKQPSKDKKKKKRHKKK